MRDYLCTEGMDNFWHINLFVFFGIIIGVIGEQFIVGKLGFIYFIYDLREHGDFIRFIGRNEKKFVDTAWKKNQIMTEFLGYIMEKTIVKNCGCSV